MTDSAYLVLPRTLDVYRRLTDAGIPCAVGGALALGYHVDNPRGTVDIDLNVSVVSSRAEEVLALLPPDVPWSDDDVARIKRDDQVRLMWPSPGQNAIPLDLFFLAGDLHEVVRSRTEIVPMLGGEIEVVSATDLTIFKALFDRAKDWPDIQSMLDAHDSTVNLDEAIRWVEAIVGEEDHRAVRLRSFRTK